MKTIKTIFAVTLSIICLFCITFTSFAAVTPTDIEVPFSINGMEAVVRDCKLLNLRQRPTSASKSLTTIPVGESVTVIDQHGKWFSVEYKDYYGFVFWKYIEFTESSLEGDSSLLGSSTIHYKSSDNRDSNMCIACDTINGTILQPGEQFIWSSIIGETTESKGYKEAPVIVNKKNVLGLGGGVCQVSTTIYNALLDTEIEPDEVHSHSIGCAYAKKDATVAHGYKNFIFTNSYDFAIKIECYSYKGVVFVNIYALDK